MLTRQHREVTAGKAKSHLKNCGWSYRTAAPVLGVTFEHLSRVLNHHRESRRLIEKVFALPHRQEIQKETA